MMRSMFSGVSGLKAHQAKMDVIGNNIANVNTVGYKGSTVSFQEVFSQTIQGAGAPQNGRGGTNPQQIGLGVNVGAITVNHTQGSTQRTDNPTDVMIDGEGYFTVTDSDSALKKYYTRAGNFTVDSSGNLVTPSGYRVVGKVYDSNTQVWTENRPITIDKTITRPASATTAFTVTGNMDSGATVDAKTNIAYTSTVDLYDSLGNKNTLTINFGQNYTTDPIVTPTRDPKDPITTAAGAQYSYRMVEFDNATYVGSPLAKSNIGTVTPLTPPATPTATAAIATTDATTIKQPIFAQFNEKGQFVKLVTGLTMTTNTNAPGGCYLSGAGTDVDTLGVKVDIRNSGSSPISIALKDTIFKTSSSELKQTSQTSDIKATATDGRAPGSIQGYSISSKGEVEATFTNGERQTLAVLALSQFDNPAGLKKTGSNLFEDTANSGTARVGYPSTGSFGSLVPGALEMSNVDLSQQFTEMITTQRGFQANSKIITTTDEMLQELVNLKR